MRLKHDAPNLAAMKTRLPHPAQLAAVIAAMAAGLGEFDSLQRWRVKA